MADAPTSHGGDQHAPNRPDGEQHRSDERGDEQRQNGSSTRVQELAERPVGDRQVREVFEEYILDGSTVGVVVDPENEFAWIQSDLTVPIEA